MAVNMFFCYICTRPFRIQVYMIFLCIYVLVRHAFSNKLDLSTSVFGELCRLVLKLWILTTPGVPLPLIAAVPQVDAGPWRWGVVGVWYMFMYIWRAFIYLSCIKLKQWFQFPQVLRPFHMFLPALYKWLKHILSLACTNCGLTSLFYI